MDRERERDAAGEPPEPGELRGPMDDYPPDDGASDQPLAERLLSGLGARPDDAPVLVHPRDGVTWTAGRLRARALQLAAALAGAGVRPGERVCCACGGHPEYGPLLLATLLAGAAWAPLNPNFDDGDLRRLLRILSPRVLLAPPPVARRLAALAAAMDGGAWEGGAPLVVALGEGAAWEALLRPRAAPPPLPPPPADPRSAPAFVCCSSGTSGLPKAVVLSHANLNACLDMASHDEFWPEQSGTMLITSPGYWVTGVIFTLYSMTFDLALVYQYGCTEQEMLASIEEHKPTMLFTANNFAVSAAKIHEAEPKHELSSLRCFMAAGAAMSRQADELVEKVFGCKVTQIYGMTEMWVLLGMSKRTKHKPGSVGLLCPFVRMKVVDPETGRTQGPGEVGELRFKTPVTTPGYMGDPQATEDLVDDKGWVLTGDLGYYDEDGFVFVTGRIKDTIKYRGVHVSPVEIEGLLDAHPAVLESAVVGVPHPTEQQLPRAYVALRAGASASAEELCRLVQDKLASHKWLRGGVVFLETLPKSATGKLNRNYIRTHLLEETPAV